MTTKYLLRHAQTLRAEAMDLDSTGHQEAAIAKNELAMEIERMVVRNGKLEEALNDARAVLCELIHPNMGVMASAIYLRAKAAEAKVRAAQSLLTEPSE